MCARACAWALADQAMGPDTDSIQEARAGVPGDSSVEERDATGASTGTDNAESQLPVGMGERTVAEAAAAAAAASPRLVERRGDRAATFVSGLSVSRDMEVVMKLAALESAANVAGDCSSSMWPSDTDTVGASCLICDRCRLPLLLISSPAGVACDSEWKCAVGEGGTSGPLTGPPTSTTRRALRPSHGLEPALRPCDFITFPSAIMCGGVGDWLRRSTVPFRACRPSVCLCVHTSRVASRWAAAAATDCGAEGDGG